MPANAPLKLADVTGKPDVAAYHLLVIGDNPGIHDDFRKKLTRDQSNALPAWLAPEPVQFHLDSAHHVPAALDMVRQAVATGNAYALAFVDMSQPTGVGGIEIIRQLLAADPGLQIVLCTASIEDVEKDWYAVLIGSDNLVFLKKPFTTVEVWQLAHVLTAKWSQDRNARSHQIDPSPDQALPEATELRLSAFAALGRSLSGAQHSKAAAEIIVDVADQLLGWDACICHLYSASENLLFPILTKDIINGQRAESVIVRTTLKPAGPALRAIQEGGQLVLREPPVLLANDTMPFGDKARPSASILWVPVRKGEEVIGLLSIQSYTFHAYNRQSLETLQALADHCSGALDRIRSEEALRRTEEQLRQSQKMEAIGLLAGGVAHDFNNLLAVILGNAEVALESAASGETSGTENLKQIVDAANRAGKLTRQLLAFSRKQVMSPKPLDLNQLVNQLGQMLRRIIGQDIHLHCVCAPALPLVQADVGMIDQAVMNLVVNARDAMKSGGEVEITTEVVDIDSSQVQRRREARVGRFVCLSVKDKGTGIAPEDLTRIFEPFFTTKGIGKGTGLGLSTVFGIVKQHQGWVEVESKLGVGSTFRIFLPTLPSAPSSAAGAPDKSASPGGSEVILFAEDEIEVRKITCLMLSTAGYRVLAAGSGPEALEIWAQHADEINLLLSDILMPGGMDGRELAQRLSAAKPALKVILLSGFTGDIPGGKASHAPRACHRFLQKPCNRKDLLRAVREVLDEPSPPLGRFKAYD